MSSTEASPATPTNTAKCEFTPCTLSQNPPPNKPAPTQTQKTAKRETRKVISHIFGRNKTLTKRVPDSIWVHYCRQHYQRARYRARNWGVAQCELVLVSLGRMQEWGGVTGFRVVLRRREMMRISSSGDGVETAGVGDEDDEVGDEDDEDGEGEAGPGTDDVEQKRKQTKTRSSTATGTKQTTGKVAGAGRAGRGRKKPSIPSAPVPAWLRVEASPTTIRSFDEVEGFVTRLMGELEGVTSGNGTGNGTGTGTAKKTVEVRFPDVEILPVFKDE